MFIALRKQSSVLGLVAKFMMSGSHARPAKLEKVDDKIVWLNVKNVYGVYQRVPSFEGESLMDSLLRSQAAGYQANCLGGDPTYRMYERPLDPQRQGLFCNTCRVIIEQPWYSRMNHEIGKPDECEESRLGSGATNPHPLTRMSCCIPVERWMNEMRLQVVEQNDLDQY